MNVIYEPTGKAKEYADLALNLYKGCTHGCRYCFGAKTPWVASEDYYKTANPKKDVIAKLLKDCRRLNGDTEILLSFVGDVYQHAEMDLGLTRQAISILIQHGLPFMILTKGGTRAASYAVTRYSNMFQRMRELNMTIAWNWYASRFGMQSMTSWKGVLRNRWGL